MPDPQVIGEILDSFDLNGSEEACHRLHFERMRLRGEFPGDGWDVVDRLVARHLGLEGDDAEQAAQLFSSTFGSHRSVAVREAADILRVLHASGAILGVVSNSDGTLAARLAQDGVCSEDGGRGTPVAFVLDSAVVGIAKPDPGIFRLAVDCLGRLGIAPQRCLYVGDTVSNDVIPAARAGFIAVHLDPHRLCDGRDHGHVSSLPELLTRWI